VFALVIPVLSLLSQVVSTSLLASGDRAGTELAYVAEGIVVFLLAVTAMVLGSIALVRRGPGGPARRPPSASPRSRCGRSSSGLSAARCSRRSSSERPGGPPPAPP
jgi:hypothetical protein